MSQTPIVEMSHNFPKARRDVSLPAILQVDKLHRDVGGYLFYKHNTFLFSSQFIIEAFVDRYPHAAAQIEKLIIKMKIEHVSGEMNRISTQNKTNRNGPWLSKLFRVPCLFQAERMTTQSSKRISSYFKGIKELTMDIEGWKQMEEYQAHAGSNSALISTAALFATSWQRFCQLYRDCHSLSRHKGSEWHVSDFHARVGIRPGSSRTQVCCQSVPASTCRRGRNDLRLDEMAG